MHIKLTILCLCYWDRVSLLSPWAVLELTRLTRLALNSEFLQSMPPHSSPRTVPTTHCKAKWAFLSTLLPFEEKSSTTPTKTELKSSAFNSLYYKDHRKKKSTSKMQVGIVIPGFLPGSSSLGLHIKTKEQKTHSRLTGSLISSDWETMVFYSWKNIINYKKPI